MRLQGAAKCLNKWRSYKSTRQFLRNLVNKNIFCKSAKMLAIAFRTWIHNAAEQSADALARELEELREEVLLLRSATAQQKADGEEMEQQLVNLQAEKMRHAQKSMKKFVIMWQHKCLLTTYHAWRGFVTKQSRDKGVSSVAGGKGAGNQQTTNHRLLAECRLCASS